MSQQYTADGFLEDCDELMQRCVKEGTLTFESFTHIWRDMNFSSLYVGRSSGCEIAELSEEVIHIAKHYMLNITDNYEQSVAGLFLVYSLLNLQPFSGFANVRITPEDITGIQHLESVARRERRYEVLYILGSVLIKGPVQYQAALRERGMEPALRKYLDGYYSKDRLGTKPKGVFYGQYEEIGLIQELNSISNRYSDAKAELSVDGLDRNLCYAKADLAKEFEKSLKKIISGNNDSLTEDEDSMFSDDATKAQNLKIKAMKNKVDPMRHLVGVHDKSVSSKEEEKSAKKSKKKANNKRTVRSLDMDYDSSECEANMTGTDVDSDNDAKVAIQIDKLPGVIRTEDGGKVYEIEIIDHQKSLGIIDDIMNEEEIKKICNKIVSPKKFGCQKFGGNTIDIEVPTTSTAAEKKDKNTKTIICSDLTSNVNELEICNSENSEKDKEGSNITGTDETKPKDVVKSKQNNKKKGKQRKTKEKSSSGVSSENKDASDSSKKSGSKRPGARVVRKPKRAKK